MKELLDEKLMETAPKAKPEKPKANANKTQDKKKKPKNGWKGHYRRLYILSAARIPTTERRKKTQKKKQIDQNKNLKKSPQPSTSKGNIMDSDIESEIEDEDPANNCCICKKFSPPGFDQCDELVIGAGYLISSVRIVLKESVKSIDRYLFC
ncbi:hypothetical protein DPMN_109766 [Dreissena polymorpha]|uniref:Uncharacterized protein n=1 Tax=Dreissena polymorpha TaxID=45954 RepID=A0A9D4KBS3_DREPO|nr:hypothetical protein DPMN_109766 [Dreissena polymorpha]